jgi:hypothetical protein
MKEYWGEGGSVPGVSLTHILSQLVEPQSTYFPRDETGLVCLPTQLERTPQF